MVIDGATDKAKPPAFDFVDCRRQVALPEQLVAGSKNADNAPRFERGGHGIGSYCRSAAMAMSRRDRLHLLSSCQDSIPMRAIPANAPPAIKVAGGPKPAHSEPARTLPSSNATPVIRLYIPSAVRLRSAGAASTTSVDNSPCVAPMCKPQKTTPAATRRGVLAVARMMSATIRKPTPNARSSRRLTTSESRPNGYALAA